jgi:sugar phosphate isomerase/epimerase
MNLMMCMNGELEELAYLPAIADLGAGIELGSYGLVGIQSEQNWERRLALHQAVRAQFQGRLAMHGPFLGMEFAHLDHLIRDVVQRRMDMTFAAAAELRASRVILHSGFSKETELFKLQETWFRTNVAFWQQEIQRWARAGITIVLENSTDKSPDHLIDLVDEVDNPHLGLCLDIGHQHLFSELSVLEWVQRMGKRLYHLHIHDNDRTDDKHWSPGRGTIKFEPLYTAIRQYAPQAILSLEVVDRMEVKMDDLRSLATYLRSK